MSTSSNETNASPSARRFSNSAEPSTRDLNRFVDRHDTARTLRNLQEAIGLSRKEFLILKYLIATPGKYIDDRQISMLMFGIFDGNPGPSGVQETIHRLKDKCLSEFGVDPIHCDPELGYMVAGRRDAA